jgi:outer membrane lipoprotein-sorting protein
VRDLVAELEASDAGDDTGNLVNTGKDKIYYKYPNKLRVDSVIRDPGGPLDGRQTITIRDGTNMWHFVSTGQYPVKKAPDSPSPTLNLPFNIQRYPQDSARKYELTGTQTINGVSTKVVRITNPQAPQDVRTVYIDPTRNVPIRLEMQIPDDKGGAPTRKRVDYKDIKRLEDGRYMPFTLEIYENDRLQKVRVYSGIKVNVGLQDSLFEPMSRFVR